MYYVPGMDTSMQPASRPSLWTGRALSGLVILFLVMRP